MGNALMNEAYVRIHKARKGSKKSMKLLNSTGTGKKWDSQRGETDGSTVCAHLKQTSTGKGLK